MIHKDGYNFGTEEAYQLYLEFKEIPNNRMSIQTEANAVVTTEMMHTYLKLAYELSGQAERYEN